MSRPTERPTTARVALWWARLPPPEVPLEPLVTLLSDDEKERARRLKVEQPRRCHVVAHAMLRTILAELAGTSPDAVVFRFGRHGKPFLEESAGDLQFNLSHSGDTIVLGVAHGVELGVDVEELRTRTNAERLASRFFTVAEAAHVAARSGDAQQRAFFHLWTIKEAYLKAVGSGITVPLNQVEADPDPDRPLRLLRIGDDRKAAVRWSLLRPELPNRAMCTVAVPGHGWQLEVREWNQLWQRPATSDR